MPNRVTITSGFRRVVMDLEADEVREVDIRPAPGVPYKPARFPTNFIYPFSVKTTAGFAPFLETPGENDDSRYLGARVRIVPVYFNP